MMFYADIVCYSISNFIYGVGDDDAKNRSYNNKRKGKGNVNKENRMKENVNEERERQFNWKLLI